MTTLAHATRLVATTRAVRPNRPLLDELGPDGFAWLRDGAGFVTSGVAAEVPADEVGAFLAAIEHEAPGDLPATGPIAVGGLPFDHTRTGSLVVPARVVGQGPDGTAWVTELHRAGAAGAVPVDPSPTEHPSRFLVSSVQSRARWRTEVLAALSAIGAGQLDKVVLAREVLVEADRPFSRRDIVARLVGSQPDCYVYAAGSLVGASPELLLARTGDRVTSRPMAGTAARNGDDGSAVLGLSDSEKDHREHRHVVDAVLDVLTPCCAELHADDVPVLARLTDVAHLMTSIEGRLRPPAPSALELARALSPTPAVAGSPRRQALEFLQAVEDFDRGGYGGPVGWVDAHGDGEWAVALRGAELDRRRARLFAGAGIVAGSDPEAEWAETEAKLAPMLRVLVTP
ncbi:MAG TPA: isochorismate synthase [Acidimicrobiia bacterium]